MKIHRIGNRRSGNWLSMVACVGLLWLLNSPAEMRSFGTAPPPLPAVEPGMQVVSTLLPTGVQQIVVVDLTEKTMAVYHIDPAQGKIQLRSVRKLIWDLRMEQFNGQSPLPSELQQVQP